VRDRHRGERAAQAEVVDAMLADLPGAAPDSSPDPLSAVAILLADDLGQRIASANAVEEAEGVPDVALARGIGADQHGEGSELKRRVAEGLETLQAKGRKSHAI